MSDDVKAAADLTPEELAELTAAADRLSQVEANSDAGDACWISRVYDRDFNPSLPQGADFDRLGLRGAVRCRELRPMRNTDCRHGGGHEMKALRYGGGAYVPKSVAICPECGGELTARSMAWLADTGEPRAADIDINCVSFLNGDCNNHRWHQSDWQPVRDVVAKWCGAVE